MMREKARSETMQLVLPFVAGSIAAAWPSLTGAFIALALFAVLLAASIMASARVAPLPARRRASRQASDSISRL
jgi:hypothetical protein